MTSRVARLFAITILLCWVLPGYAAIYRCTDGAGHVLFTQDHCAHGQQSEVVNLGRNDSSSETNPGSSVCRQVEKLAEVIYPHIQQKKSVLDIYSDLGGREYLSAGITAVVNYVYAFRYTAKAKKSDVAALTREKCLDGGFGDIKKKDLPDWKKIKYVRKKTEKKPVLSKEQLAKRQAACQDISHKLEQARRRLDDAKNKGQKMQARLDVEYFTKQAKQKCDKGKIANP